MNRDKLRSLITGVIATVPTPFDESYRVDYGRMAEATNHWVENGVVNGKAVIKVAAAMGEGPQLSENEWSKLIKTVVETTAGRAQVMAAIHYKDTVRTIEDAKIATDLGAIGLQISPPIFNQPSEADMLRHFSMISDAIDIGILVYNTHWMPGGAIYPDTFRKMSDFEQVAAIKWSPPSGTEYEEIFELKDTFNIIDNADRPADCGRLGGHGFVSDGIAAYPPFYVGTWDMVLEGRYEEAEAQWDAVVRPLRVLAQKWARISGGEGSFEKALQENMGIPMGPPRPPSIPVDAENMKELKQAMIGWGWPVPNA